MLLKIKRAISEGRFIQKSLHAIIMLPIWLMKKADGLIARVSRYVLTKCTKIEHNKIVFMTYNDDYSCNPKYIAEEIIRQQLPWDLVWIVPKSGSMLASHFPPQIRRVRRNSYYACKEIASAKVWIDNSINFLWNTGIPKKNGQVYIETWHGSMGIKRVGKDDVKNKKWVKRANIAKKITDYCISNSTFENDVYRTTHWPATPILLYGHPRNDCMFDKALMAKAREKVSVRYGLSQEDHIVLYAPTFRDNGSFDCYQIDFQMLVDVLEERFGGSWKIFLRLHFHDRKKKVQKKFFPECVINVTNYPDMQELLMSADVGITDYSSWAYDFVLTRRPLFLYANDMAQYNNDRGLYYPLEETPFPIAENNNQLMENIFRFDDYAYQQRIECFLADKGCIEDGHASERVVEKLKEIIGEST